MTVTAVTAYCDIVTPAARRRRRHPAAAAVAAAGAVPFFFGYLTKKFAAGFQYNSHPRTAPLPAPPASYPISPPPPLTALSSNCIPAGKCPPPPLPPSVRTQTLPPSCCLRGEIKSTLGAPRFCSAFSRAYTQQPVFLLSCGSCTVTVRPPRCQHCPPLARLNETMKSRAVVTPGAILLGLLKNSGVPEVAIGGWRGALAVSGALGTFLAPWLLKRKGIMASAKSAKIPIIGMQTAITSAAALYMLRNTLPQGMQLFLLPVTLSRMFLYAYDLVEVQVTSPCPPRSPHFSQSFPVSSLQGIQLVDGSVRGVVSSTETSFTNIATLLAYGVTAAVHDPSQFHVLVIIG